MRNIGAEWRNLAEGLLRVEALEARFRAEWGPRLEKAREERDEAERQRYQRQGRAALVSALVVALILFLIALGLLLLHRPAVSIALFWAVLVPTMLVLYGLWSLLRTPAPLPIPSDLSGRWWRMISVPATSVRRTGPAFSARGYGDQGEAAFVSYLASRLSEDYVAIRGLLMARNLDADVIVAGPTGVWVYEVKHWSGEIICERGQWRRVKTYREPGGRLVRELEALRPFDRQWAKEADAVKGALRRALPDWSELPDAVGGGLVFTHRGSSFFTDGSCRAWYGRPESCVEVLSDSPEIPHLTMERHLRAIDALLDWSDVLHERQGETPWKTEDAVELAERLHEGAVTSAFSYVSHIGEPVSDMISEETKEARNRAFWHPHPDDPPTS